MAFCLGTLVDLLDQILHPHHHHQNWVLDDEKKPQIQFLFEMATFLREFLANSTPAIQARIETLEDLIRDASENAEDILDSYLKAQILSNPVDPIRQLQSLLEKASLFRMLVAESAPIQTNFEVLEDAIRDVANNVEGILESYTKAQILDYEKIPQIRSLSEHSSVLRDFVAKAASAIRAIPETLEDQIGDEAENQDISHLQDRLVSLQGIIEDAAKNSVELVLSNPNSCGTRFMISPPDLSEVIQVFDTAATEITKVKDEVGQSVHTAPVVASKRSNDLTSNDVVVVGVDKCLIELKERLTSQSSPTLEIIPIVGMGGIGKTTLARKLYNQYSSCKHFDICLWAIVSQQYDQRQVLLSLLSCRSSDKKNEELKVDLHQMLWSRRYLIVLDDVWSSKVWDDICTCTPDNNNRSRIILTTRENDVANYVSSIRHEMQLLNKEDSWKLFEKIVLAGEECPSELEEIARKIVKKCGGLPLALDWGIPVTS